MKGNRYIIGGTWHKSWSKIWPWTGRKVKIEIAVEAKMADKVVETIKAASESGKIGDGKIFTLDLEAATRIRTGETGADAL